MVGRRCKPKTKRTRPKAKAKLNLLNDQQHLYVQEYCVDLNGRQAAKRAGYTGRDASIELMKKPHIQEAIRVQLGKRARETEIDAERVLCELAMIAFSDPADMFDEDGSLLHIKDMPPEIRKTIAGCDVMVKEGRDGTTRTIAKIKFWSKLEALTAIGKHLGILGSPVEQKHLHLHTVDTNPYLNAPDDLVLDAMSALTRLEHSVGKNSNPDVQIRDA